MQTLNPIEQRRVSGMSAIAAFLTESTCGEACWQAHEDICRCSCGGKNHGCMRTADGSRPARTARIDGFMYELKAVGEDGMWEAARKINEAAGVKFHYASTSRDRSDRWVPAKLRLPSETQIAKWPELAAYRAHRDSFNPQTDIAKDFGKPYLLWVRPEYIA